MQNDYGNGVVIGSQNISFGPAAIIFGAGNTSNNTYDNVIMLGKNNTAIAHHAVSVGNTNTT